MKIIFLGSAQFAVPSLKLLASSSHDVCCVVTQPDHCKGRGLSIASTPVKVVAKEDNLKLYQPENINTLESVRFLKGLDADLFIVVAYGQILSQAVLDAPKVFTINLHASLLPRYRGAAPINWAIINGEKETGVTIVKVIRQMDAGPIILQKKISIAAEDTALTLEKRLSDVGARLLLQTLKLIQNSMYTLISQDNHKVVMARRLKKEDGLIHWNKSALDIINLIRGCVPWPGAFTYYRGQLVKIYQGQVSHPQSFSSSSVCGELISIGKSGIGVACGTDAILIKELQVEGRRRMSAENFLTGHKLRVGEILGEKR